MADLRLAATNRWLWRKHLSRGREQLWHWLLMTDPLTHHMTTIPQLTKLRITDSEVMTNAGFIIIFIERKNKPPTFTDSKTWFLALFVLECSSCLKKHLDQLFICYDRLQVLYEEDGDNGSVEDRDNLKNFVVDDDVEDQWDHPIATAHETRRLSDHYPQATWYIPGINHYDLPFYPLKMRALPTRPRSTNDDIDSSLPSDHDKDVAISDVLSGVNRVGSNTHQLRNESSTTVRNVYTRSHAHLLHFGLVIPRENVSHAPIRPIPHVSGRDARGLDHFHITNLWTKVVLGQNNEPVRIFMVRVEKINLDSRSWWTPKESIGPDAGEFRLGQYSCHMWTEAVVGSHHRLVKVFMIRRGKVKLSPAVLSRLEAAFRKTVAELHESKPEPSAEPPVWAEVKAALADAVPYFRKHQGSLYTKDRIAQGMLIDAEYGTSTYTPTECIELVPESHRLPVVDYIAYFLGSLIDFRLVIDTHFNRWALLGRTVTVNMAIQTASVFLGIDTLSAVNVDDALCPGHREDWHEPAHFLNYNSVRCRRSTDRRIVTPFYIYNSTLSDTTI
ncbi:hypothetical protein M434DRAFT_32784 [Hypoxylon sp. CO27-5]|nr:hypothetical protein M434DRAFT_32784 [Hypoxylon sp. CO27-5]